jgi:hypothetical protein
MRSPAKRCRYRRPARGPVSRSGAAPN